MLRNLGASLAAAVVAGNWAWVIDAFGALPSNVTVLDVLFTPCPSLGLGRAVDAVTVRSAVLLFADEQNADAGGDCTGGKEGEREGGCRREEGEWT